MSVQLQPAAPPALGPKSDVTRPTTSPAKRRTTIGQKVVMAITGLVLFGFVVGHMLGNLQAFLPRGADGVWALDAYGVWLREVGHGAGIWVARIGLLVALVLHLGAAWSLTRTSWAARPIAYRKWNAQQSTYASRTMRVSGPLILLFVVYHLMHLTWGNVHPDFVAGGVHHNVVVGLVQPLAAAIYVVAMIGLGFHLFHGIWSLLQTLGLAHPRYEKLRRGISASLAVVVVLGNLSIVIAALLGRLPH